MICPSQGQPKQREACFWHKLILCVTTVLLSPFIIIIIIITHKRLDGFYSPKYFSVSMVFHIKTGPRIVLTSSLCSLQLFGRVPQ